MKNPGYQRIINRFSGKRILVIGDLLVDVYLKGVSTRLCPEAPVPVVDVQDKQVLLGGAANTVCNLKSLGATVVFCSVIGTDAEGDEALALLQAVNIDTSNIIRRDERKTITKTRVLSGTQVITRIDQGSEYPVNEITSTEIFKNIQKAYQFCDAVLISDYDKGTVTTELVERLTGLQKRYPKFIGVDSKRLSFFSSLPPSYGKPNYDEFISLLGLPYEKQQRKEQVIGQAANLYQKTGAALITVTLDKDGCVVIENGQPTGTFSTPSVNKPFVAGAGDSFISAFVLSYISCGDKEISCEIGNAAAAIAIRKECTATCSHTELRTFFQVHTKWVHDLRDLKEICDVYHRDGRRVVFTNGCFDILHSGHVTYLHAAKQLGDVLIVGLNTDESIKRIKGQHRPINCLSDRLQVLAGLSSVDHVIAFGTECDDTPVPLIRLVRPHVFVKGGDYTKEKLPEAETVEACGGEIVFIDQVPDHSTTRIINRITEVALVAKT